MARDLWPHASSRWARPSLIQVTAAIATKSNSANALETEVPGAMPDKSKHRYRLVSFILTQILFLSGLDASSAADDAAGARLKDVDTITILPIVFPANQSDADRKESMEGLYGKLDEYIYKALLRKLAMKGYVLDKPRGWSPPGNWTVESLKPLAPQELAAIAPDTASYVAYLFVERLASSNQVVKSSAQAAISALILRRDSGAVVWQRADEGRFSENILFGIMWLTPDKHAAIEAAFEKLFAGLPEKPFD
jgi:hypothetical protein